MFFFRVYTEKEHLAIYLLFPEEIISYFLIVSGIQCFEIFVGPMCFSALRIWLSFFYDMFTLAKLYNCIMPLQKFFFISFICICKYNLVPYVSILCS